MFARSHTRQTETNVKNPMNHARRFQMLRFMPMLMMLAVVPVTVEAGVPTQISHQGVITVNDLRFTGDGHFYFALVGLDTNTNLWTSDGTKVDPPSSDRPITAVHLNGIVNVVYNVRLGLTDSELGIAMPPIPPSVFNNNNVVLRIWFDDTQGNGIQQLSPDQPLTSAPYAMAAATSPPIGSIIAWHRNVKDPAGGANPLPLPDGWIQCDGQILSDAQSPLNGVILPDLNAALPGGKRRFLRGTSAVSGDMEADEFKAHRHKYQERLSDGNSNLVVTPRLTDRTNGDFGGGPFFTDLAGGASETRPVNMSVVWIMRVK